MEDKKLIQYLELMKKDIYQLANKYSQISSGIKSTNTQEKIQKAKLDRIEHNQEQIIQSINSLSSRLSELEIRSEHSDERVEDIHTEFTIFKQSLLKKRSSSTESKKVSNSLEAELFDKISQIEEHFSSEIARIYDNMFNEILDLKSDIEKLK